MFCFPRIRAGVGGAWCVCVCERVGCLRRALRRFTHKHSHTPIRPHTHTTWGPVVVVVPVVLVPVRTRPDRRRTSDEG